MCLLFVICIKLLSQWLGYIVSKVFTALWYAPKTLFHSTKGNYCSIELKSNTFSTSIPKNISYSSDKTNRKKYRVALSWSWYILLLFQVILRICVINALKIELYERWTNKGIKMVFSSSLTQFTLGNQNGHIEIVLAFITPFFQCKFKNFWDRKCKSKWRKAD